MVAASKGCFDVRVTFRRALCVSLATFAMAAGLACGPSFQAIYEGNARFEHCYGPRGAPADAAQGEGRLLARLVRALHLRPDPRPHPLRDRPLRRALAVGPHGRGDDDGRAGHDPADVDHHGAHPHERVRAPRRRCSSRPMPRRRARAPANCRWWSARAAPASMPAPGSRRTAEARSRCRRRTASRLRGEVPRVQERARPARRATRRACARA